MNEGGRGGSSQWPLVIAAERDCGDSAFNCPLDAETQMHSHRNPVIQRNELQLMHAIHRRQARTHRVRPC
jgi:hypothetical protein